MAKYKIIYGSIMNAHGEPLLEVGDVVELSDEDGAHMIAAGNVVKVSEDAPKVAKK